jgi:hypothetical protein
VVDETLLTIDDVRLECLGVFKDAGLDDDDGFATTFAAYGLRLTTDEL